MNKIPEKDTALAMWLDNPETFARHSLMGRDMPEKKQMTKWGMMTPQNAKLLDKAYKRREERLSALDRLLGSHYELPEKEKYIPSPNLYDSWVKSSTALSDRISGLTRLKMVDVDTPTVSDAFIHFCQTGAYPVKKPSNINDLIDKCVYRSLSFANEVVSGLNSMMDAPDIVKNDQSEISDDFLHFCQTGKYPDEVEPGIDDEVKAHNQYTHEVKKNLRNVIGGTDCAMVCPADNDCPCEHLNVYALLELAAEIAPDTSFAEDAFSEVLDVYQSNPERVIDNQPR